MSMLYVCDVHVVCDVYGVCGMHSVCVCSVYGVCTVCVCAPLMWVFELCDDHCG